MKLSEAILLGAMISPQAFRALFRGDGACALGGALLAVGATGEPALHSVRDQWPWAMTVSANCPSCGRSCPVFGVITHLNDTHRWTREQIAGWVASIEPAEAWPPEEIPEAAWRDYHPEDTLRFYALRLHEAGMIKSTPQKILAQGTDWRFLNELRRS